MFISPEEFLKRTERYGISRGDYKNAMISVTGHEQRLQDDINQGKDFYFSYNLNTGCLQYFSEKEDNLHLRIGEDDNYTYAFKLLKVIAD